MPDVVTQLRTLVKKSLRPAVRAVPDRLRDIMRALALRRAKRRIFIDCGANTCHVLREYIARFPEFEFFAFEAQPELADEGAKVVREYPRTKISFFNKAVWTKDETLNFYLSTRWDANYRGGSTLLNGHVNNSAAVDYSSPIQVEAIDLSAWIGDNFCEDDYLIIKMDIEGAEYDVLEKIIRDNNHRMIKELIVEFHQQMNPTISKERHEAVVRAVRRFARLEVWH